VGVVVVWVTGRRAKELATVTMYLVERGGLLSNMKEELMGVIKKLNIPNLAFELRGVFKMITDYAPISG
jgi:hypothetical protein